MASDRIMGKSTLDGNVQKCCEILPHSQFHLSSSSLLLLSSLFASLLLKLVANLSLSAVD